MDVVFRSRYARYGSALVLSASAVGVQLLFESQFTQFRGYPLVIASAVAAVLGGIGPGLVCLALSSAFLAWMFRAGAAVPAPSLSQWIVFEAATLLLLFVLHRARHARIAAESVNSNRSRILEAVADAAPVMVWMAGRDNEGTFFNRGWLDFTGRTAAQEQGDGWIEGVHPEDREECARACTTAFNARQPFKTEFRLRRHDGAYRWVLDQGTPLYSPSGAFEGYIGSCIDIDDMKRAFDDRRTLLSTIDDERERLKNIVSNVPGVVWEAWGAPDESGQRIDFVSDHVQRMLGYTVEEWLATPNFWLSIVHPEDREEAARNAGEHFAAGGTRTNRFRWVTKDGRAIAVEAHSTVIADASGRAIGMRGVTMDITARTRAEESLRFLAQASEVLASSLDYETTIATAVRLALPVLADVCLVDLLSEDGTSIRRLAAAHAKPEKEHLAAQLLQYPPALDGATATNEALRLGLPFVNNRTNSDDMAHRIHNPEHAQLVRDLGTSSYLAVPMQARGRLLGALVFTSEEPDRYDDLTIELATLLARRAAIAVDNARLYRTAVNATHARDEFLATVSHELRTPMTSTLGWVKLMALGQLDRETQTVALQAIERSTHAQARLIDDILDVSSITLGKFTLKPEEVDFASVVEAAIGAVRPAIDAKGISIVVDASGWAGTVRGDAARLQQVVWNLLSNAIKFGREGGRVEVTLSRHDQVAELVVTDDGPGMDHEVLPRVFERFWQAESGTTRTYGGLGLGLAIVRHLVELHGGTVRAESAGPGQGARFIVEIPVGSPRLPVTDTPRETPSASTPSEPLLLPDLQRPADGPAPSE